MIDERARYGAWWVSGPGRPCERCKEGNSREAQMLQAQGRSFFPARVFGPDRVDRPVRYLLVAMEPAEDWINKKGTDIKAWWNLAGAKPGSDGTVQFAAREWLCDNTETFLMTDIAKCPAAEATATRSHRWGNCDLILQEEVGLFPSLRAVIGVGKAVRDDLRARPWMKGRRLFRILHWSGVGVANQMKLFAALPEAERGLSSSDIARYRAFVNERRRAIGKDGDHDVEVKASTTALLAVYRRQFGCIKRALLDARYDCGRRGDGTCCRAVPQKN